MSDVLEFRPPPPPYELPNSKLGRDETWVRFCAEWRALRAQQQKKLGAAQPRHNVWDAA
jgi:hypothetical protein